MKNYKLSKRRRDALEKKIRQQRKKAIQWHASPFKSLKTQLGVWQRVFTLLLFT